MKKRGALSRAASGLALVAALGATLACAEETREASGDGANDRKDPPNKPNPSELEPHSTGTQVKVGDVLDRCSSSATAPATLRRLTRGEYKATIEDVLPEIKAGGWSDVKMSPDQASILGFTNNSAVLTVAQQTAGEILKTAEDVATRATADEALSTLLPCSSTGDEACAGALIDKYGPLFFRRPITSEEKTRYLDLYKLVSGQADFKTGVKWTLVALLQSPYTVYRSEIGEVEGERRVLDQYELASNLSYTYASQPPDAELLALAADGKLSDPQVRYEQAARLIRTPRGLEMVRTFFRDWLGYGTISNKERDDVENFPALAQNMIEETRLYIDNAIFQDHGDYEHLLTGDFTILNPALSAHYGFGDVTEGWARVQRPPNWGLGLLAQGAVLASTSHEGATSPTLRGLLVFEKILCNNRPKPPAGVPPIEQSEAQANTTRERYEKIHLADSTCASCHRKWDPSGFTFEQFDETGRYRADENSYPIDTSGWITVNGEDIEVADLEGLARQVETVPEMTDCFSGFLSAYMFGGGGGMTCLAEPEREALANGEIGIEEFLLRLTNAPSFTTRW